MRLDLALLAVSLLGSASASAIDGPRPVAKLNTVAQDEQALFRRRGGGGSGGRGGGGSGGSSGAGSSGGSSSAGRGPPGSSTSGGGSGSPGNNSPQSNIGGTSRGGSGPSPSFGGGRFYGGGGTRPYRAGGISPLGIAPFALAGAALAFWPGVWLSGAHLYPYNYVHRYHNATTDKDETAKVLCACSQDAECGCDENNDTVYYDSLIGNGSYAALNKSVVNVGEYKGEKTLLINGTLPNGTTADGLDSDESSAAGFGTRSLVEAAGFWPVVAAVAAAVFLT